MNALIGENIKIMRCKCGFTQKELAARISVTPQAVSKWENGNGTPDIAQLVLLAKVFGTTTDSLLGVVSATYGKAHTEAAVNQEKLLMATAQPIAEKHLAAYTYLRGESEKEPTNYRIMRMCINHGAEISRHTDFHGFLSDRPEFRDEIFEDCERKNIYIARYCEDRRLVEESDYAMIWIYIHTKQFDKAGKLMERLPSLESNMLKESIMTQFIHFQYGFEKEKAYIMDNIAKLRDVTAKEFFYSLEDYAHYGDSTEAIAMGNKFLKVLEAYKDFEEMRPATLVCENRLRRFMPRCYASAGAYEKAAEEIRKIAANYREMAERGYMLREEIKGEAEAGIKAAYESIKKESREQVKACRAYEEAMAIIADL